jgi:BirA family biotin operon repressor/biotin-[acetyl-CoA-carboxylase] ligase
MPLSPPRARCWGEGFGPSAKGYGPYPPVSAPWRLVTLDDVDSTSDYVIARARAGEAEHLAVIARRQTAGRGRAGRQWFAASGGLALSALMRPAACDGQWSLLAGLAVREGLASCVAQGERLRLKWPNDVMVEDAKLAGVLVDSAVRPDGSLDWLVIGVGANLETAPAIADRPTACLAALGFRGGAQEAARMVLERLAHWRGVQERQGFGPVRAAWVEAADAVGTPLAARVGGVRLVGRFAGLAESGALRLETETGTLSITTGEIDGQAAV